ncbi:MAG TPA: cyclic nucleotide-binding domain-containing protein [Candidatus Limnocylindrales bacterium]
MEDHRSVIAMLHETWFGSELPPETQDRLASLASIIAFEAAEELLREGAETTRMGIVLDGRLALHQVVPGRGPVTILSVEPGDIFGWSVLTPPYRASSTVLATQPGRAIVFGGAALRTALAADHALAASLYPRVLQAVGRRLAATRLQLLDLFAS